MKKLSLLAVLCVAASVARAQTVLTGENSVEVEYATASGTYENYDYNTTYWAFGFQGTGAYLGFGVVDFNAAAIAGQSITAASFQVGNDDYHLNAGDFTIWAVTDNTTDLSTTQIDYDPNVTGGYDGQLGTATALGTYYYDGTGGTPLTYSLDSSGFSALEALANSSNNDIRLVLTGDGASYVTFDGTGNSDSTLVPQLLVTAQAVPAPAGVFAFGLGIVGLAIRRRK